MQYLREHGEECNTSTGQIGVMGFSAGGHLASTVATHLTGDELPVFQILFYPVITMNATNTHAGSRQNLLGSNPKAALVNEYSNEKQVSEETPPAYICYANNDGTVPIVNSTIYATALKRKGVPVHVIHFATGGHGFGFKTTYEHHDEIVADLTQWLLGIDEMLTGILGPSVSHPNSDACYNVAGQPVSLPSHGIYITQGKKWLVR